MHRFHDVMAKRRYDVDDVAAGREFIEAIIGWIVFSHHLCVNVTDCGGHERQHTEKAGSGLH